MSKSDLTKEKRTAVNRFLFDEYVLVHVDPTKPGVTLPDNLMNQATVTLKLSKLFRGKLIVEDETISAELLFGGDYFNCLIPFEAMWGLTSIKGKQMVWPESVPKAISNQVLVSSATTEPPAAKDSDKNQPREIKRGHLKRVK